jgi:esterase/lipase superfamily enzyme
VLKPEEKSRAMYVITNRNLKKTVFDPFAERAKDAVGRRVNDQGPNELRLFEARRVDGEWRIALVPDEPLKDDRTMEEAGKIKWLPKNEPCYGSHLVAHRVVAQARQEKRSILLFVHGFNNDIVDVLDRAEGLEKLYGVIVVPFSWPANGGGAAGVASYKSDKRDAKASVGALDRVLLKAAEYLGLINAEAMAGALAAASKAHPDNAEKRDELVAKLMEKRCPFKVSLLLHSMGSYLYKQMLKSSASEGNSLLFDNVILAAADTNNLDHSLWVDMIAFRRRIYITINENDQALAASRAKGGEEQLARLGHHPFDLSSRHAIYVNLTDAPWVKRSHACFEGDPVKRNQRLRTFFDQALRGETAEIDLRFVPDRNFYVL